LKVERGAEASWFSSSISVVSLHCWWFHHLRNPEPWLFNPVSHWLFGLSGVDIFFVISGFIMFTAARDEPPLEFCRRRVIRIIPMYWIATFGLIFLSLLGFGVPPHDWAQFVKSLLLIPHYNPMLPDQIWPYLVPSTPCSWWVCCCAACCFQPR
jgi:exopolysaccharide production protein ExoZ